MSTPVRSAVTATAQPTGTRSATPSIRRAAAPSSHPTTAAAVDILSPAVPRHITALPDGNDQWSVFFDCRSPACITNFVTRAYTTASGESVTQPHGETGTSLLPTRDSVVPEEQLNEWLNYQSDLATRLDNICVVMKTASKLDTPMRSNILRRQLKNIRDEMRTSITNVRNYAIRRTSKPASDSTTSSSF